MKTFIFTLFLFYVAVAINNPAGFNFTRMSPFFQKRRAIFNKTRSFSSVRVAPISRSTSDIQYCGIYSSCSINGDEGFAFDEYIFYGEKNKIPTSGELKLVSYFLPASDCSTNLYTLIERQEFTVQQLGANQYGFTLSKVYFTFDEIGLYLFDCGAYHTAGEEFDISQSQCPFVQDWNAAYIYGHQYVNDITFKENGLTQVLVIDEVEHTMSFTLDSSSSCIIPTEAPTEAPIQPTTSAPTRRPSGSNEDSLILILVVVILVIILILIVLLVFIIILSKRNTKQLKKVDPNQQNPVPSQQAPMQQKEQPVV